jgi:hypothetical protein
MSLICATAAAASVNRAGATKGDAEAVAGVAAEGALRVALRVVDVSMQNDTHI